MNLFIPFELLAAVRFLMEGRFQTALTVIGASVGVAVVVFMSALLAGVQANIFGEVLRGRAHIVITPREDVARPLFDGTNAAEAATIQQPAQRLRSVDQWQKIQATLQAMPEIIVVSPLVSGAAFAIKGEAIRSVTLFGVDQDTYFKVVDLPGKIIAGNARLVAGDLIIGKELGIKMGVGLGERLRIRSATGADEIYTITGIFDLGSRGPNENSVYVPFRTGQTLLGLPGGASSVDLTIVDPFGAEAVSAQVAAATGLKSESWIETLAQLFIVLKSQNISFSAIQFFVALAVALGIASVMVVSVVQRSKEIGILRAMGARRSQILRIFLLQGAIVGLLGSILGSAMGAGFIMIWRLFAKNPDGTPFFLITVTASLFFTAAVVATLTGVLAALLPAMSAARLNPVDAIRG